MMQAHDEGNRCVEEVHHGGRKYGYVDMLPGEGKQEHADALGHEHQSLVVCNKSGREKAKLKVEI